jgi:hypothetical protein
MAGVERMDLEDEAPDRRPIAFGVALGIDLLAILGLFALVFVWPIVILALMPYVGGRVAGRFVDRRTAIRIGALAGAIMVTVLVAILFSLLAEFPQDLKPFEPVGLSMVVLAYFLGSAFGALGGRHGGLVEGSD